MSTATNDKKRSFSNFFFSGPSFIKNMVTYAFVIVAFVVVQILVGTNSISHTMQGLLTPICAWIVVALGLNLTVGIMGDLSLGHAGFMSIGAFSGATIAIILRDTVQDDVVRLIISLLVGALFAAVAGALIGIPVLRLNGDYLAIVTLAFGEIIKNILYNIYIGMDSDGLHVSFFDDKISQNLADGGKMIIKGPSGINGIKMISTFISGIILIVIVLFIIFSFVNSRTGRAVMAIRDNRIAAECVGLNVTKYKMIAFVISAAIAGSGGALYASCYPTFGANKFDFNTSILILVFVVLGGQGNMLGTIIAATILTILPEALREFSDYRMLVYAIVLIVVMLATNNPTIKNFFSKLFSPFKNILGKFFKKEASVNEQN